MSGNSHFTVALHILTWMALATQDRELVTSDEIAESVKTNPVFIRRILGSLLKAKLVKVQRGTGAGWKLARPADAIRLDQVYDAIEEPPLFELHHGQPNQSCPVGRGIQPALTGFYADAAMALKQQLAQSTVADVLAVTLNASRQTV